MSMAAAAVGVLLVAGLVAGSYWQGRQDGQATCEAAAAREERVARLAGAAAASAAGEQIARITVRHTTIRQEAEREVQVRTEYRDCQHSAHQLQRINAALSSPASSATGAGQLPGPDATGR